MERKIGEIFEYNGEWYQCIKQPEDFIGKVCKICAFQDTENCEIDECSDSFRSDEQDVIFKKLEKVGEPYTNGCKLFQRYKLFTPTNELVNLEIQQNKEDMEEKNNAKHSNFEKIEKNLKEFNLEAAKSGKPVCTRDGRKARIICFDREHLYEKQDYSIVALIKEGPYSETVCSYTKDGLYSPGKIHNNDLMMIPEKKEGWVNIYRDIDNNTPYTENDNIYSSRDKAKESAKMLNTKIYIDTVKISWEE